MTLTIYNLRDVDFINTSEAYSKFAIVGINNIVIPYVNIGLTSKNPINNKQSVVSFSYYAFRQVRSMFVNGNKVCFSLEFNVLANKNEITDFIMLGGYEDSEGAEVKVICRDRIFYLPDNSDINDSFHPFIPCNTPNYQQNLDTLEVDNFFHKNNLPFEIRELLGANYYCISLSNNLQNES